MVREYPLSPLASNAKNKLTKLGAPIPQPDSVAVARMKREPEIERGRPGMFHKATGLLRSTREVRMGARSGSPNMTPSGEASPGTETLTPGGTTALGGPGAAAGNSAIVQTVPTGGSGPAAGTGTGTGSTSGGGAPPAEAATTPPAADSGTGSST